MRKSLGEFRLFFPLGDAPPLGYSQGSWDRKSKTARLRIRSLRHPAAQLSVVGRQRKCPLSPSPRGELLSAELRPASLLESLVPGGGRRQNGGRLPIHALGQSRQRDGLRRALPRTMRALGLPISVASLVANWADYNRLVRSWIL
jgi:hypothetical protein